MGILTDKLKCRLGEPFRIKGNVEKGLLYQYSYELIIGSSEGETVIGNGYEAAAFANDGFEITLGEDFVRHASPYGDGRMCYIKATGRRKRPLQDEETVEYITYINLFGDLLPEFTLETETDNSKTDFRTGRAIKGFSKVTARVKDISVNFGGEVEEVEFTGGVFSKIIRPEEGQTVFEVTLDPIENSGEIFVFVNVLTTHGYRSSKSLSFTVLDYSPPTLNMKTAKRFYDNGDDRIYIESSSGADKTVGYPLELEGEIMPCTMKDGETQLCSITEINTKAQLIRINDLSTAEIELITEGNRFSFENIVFFEDGKDGIEIFCAYELRVFCTDSSKREYTLAYRINTLGTAFHLKAGGRGAKFGGYATEDDLLESDWDIRGNGNLKIKGETSLQKMTATKLCIGEDKTEYNGVGSGGNNIAKGNHGHGFIGTDGKLYDAEGKAQKKTVLVTDDEGNIIGAYHLTSDFLLMATDDGVMKPAGEEASAGTAEKGFCYADHIHPYSGLWKNDEEYRILLDRVDVLEKMSNLL